MVHSVANGDENQAELLQTKPQLFAFAARHNS
jgi:hypothetical protein